MKIHTSLSAFGLLAILAFPAVSTAGPKCFPREGHCVVVQVNGQSSAKLAGKTKSLLRGFKDASHHVGDTRYELRAPIRGTFAVKADPAPGSDDWFRGVREADVAVVPLQNVRVDTHREQTKDESVRIGGAAAVKDQEVLNENRLPPGNYLMVVTLWGNKNWDRQVLFFTVEQE